MVKKLVPNLQNKKKYIVHGRVLKFYTSLGLKLTKIHRAIEFYQRDWMTPYIMFNTDQRKKATSEFEKDLFKLLNNAVSSEKLWKM